jgi:hypothetical protein
MIVILIDDPLLIKGSTIGSRTNPSGAIAPSWGIGILLNLSISRGLTPTLFRRTIHEQCSQNIQNAQTTLQHPEGKATYFSRLTQHLNMPESAVMYYQ